jgi:hypothetical protein
MKKGEGTEVQGGSVKRGPLSRWVITPRPMAFLITFGILIGIPLLFKVAGLIGKGIGSLLGSVLTGSASLAQKAFRKTSVGTAISVAVAVGIGVEMYLNGPGRLIEAAAAVQEAALSQEESGRMGQRLFGIVSVQNLLAAGVGALLAHCVRWVGARILTGVGRIDWGV